MPYPVDHDGAFVLTQVEFACLEHPPRGALAGTSLRTRQTERRTVIVSDGAAAYWRQVYALADEATQLADGNPGITEQECWAMVAGLVQEAIDGEDAAQRAYPWVRTDDLPPFIVQADRESYGTRDLVPRVRWGMVCDVIKEIGARQKAGAVMLPVT